jgi:hypothetical protein
MLLIISCSNKPKEKVKVTEVTLQDIKQEEKNVEPPSPPPLLPPKIDSGETVQKCFKNEGLKYTTTINLFVGDKHIIGQVVAQEIGNNNKPVIEDFDGTINGNTLNIKFKHKPPVIGDASEWTDKPWTIKKTEGKETLLILFNSKNYDTNKWENMTYEFEACK